MCNPDTAARSIKRVLRMPILEQQVTTDAMARCLEQGLGKIRGERICLQELKREPFRGSSSFATEHLTALLDDGESIEIFFKDLNPANQLDEARIIREQGGLERSQRELSMYQHVLTPLKMGTPKLYSYRWEPSEDIYWIFLEHAGPKRLSRLGDFDLWVEATRWVAKLHAVDYRRLDDVVAQLPLYDADHFQLCVHQVKRNFSRFNEEQQSVVSQALERYYGILDYLNNLPKCLIHGEYFGKNVMVRPVRTDGAIAVIDWETAALGPRCVDLVSITAGRWTPEQRREMKQAYAESYESETGLPVDLVELNREMANVALYRALWWVGYWSQGDDAHIERWIRELTKVMAQQQVFSND
jgi:hypothetical protein